MTQTFLIGDYRSDLLDMLQGIADADPALIRQDWVRAAVGDMRQLASDGRVILAKNYGKKLIDPIPFEPPGEPSRFLTYQWTLIQRTFGAEAAAHSYPAPPLRSSPASQVRAATGRLDPADTAKVVEPVR